MHYRFNPPLSSRATKVTHSALVVAIAGLAACASNVETTTTAGTTATRAEGSCPAITLADTQGIGEGKYPQQYDLQNYEAETGCEMAFVANPEIEDLNGEIQGNTDLPPIDERIPNEPLVVVPYEEIGQYGGILAGLSKATESGTSDLLSTRHVNLFRYSDDLKTLVPNIARDFEWNDDYTILTVYLREGHKWSDGEPFTAEDIVFWYNNVLANKTLYSNGIPDRFLVNGQPMEVEAVNPTTVTFTLSQAKPGLTSLFATDYAQPFLPKHFLGKYHPDVDSNAEKNAKDDGFESWDEAFNFYYGSSDWKDVPSPLLKDTAKANSLERAVMPTLESHIVIADTAEGRRLVANPYFYQVDTTGQQLPYISRIDEVYVPEKEVQNLKLSNGEVVYKSQAVFAEDLPVLQQNESKGNYTVSPVPTVGESMVVYSFNVNHKDEGLREIFDDLRFRQAVSHAMNREEMNELVYFGLATPAQYTAIDPNTVDFITEEQKTYLIEYDPDKANELLDEMGLVDANGDGKRDRLDGQPLVINLQFATQGGAVKLHELFVQYLDDVGINMQLKEVTSDEYRASQASNDLDIMTWTKAYTSAFVAGSREPFFPPFGDYFSLSNGHLWAKYIETNGAEGLEPPEWVTELDRKSIEYQKYTLGTEESNQLGKEIVDLLQSDLLFIGTVGNPAEPVYHRNDLGNFKEFTAKSYDYYWAYPYRPSQWFLK
ncbi:MAG: ABC transporter substrate-binding protein [Roseofilum sp. SBFL]|uniref:ABC transporter substrate-binding protein n=1 Tax=unclassified Roseofilum TaxID=2620099 RepID=UPI001B0B66BD|nr:MULTISPECIES: ABC transporter substrate-binding protein [unclassified Roseofilum]MBP0013254.1 ABC transporter substrate-binding protein [Roseofilum sp. SID3]MBP0026400.1 ABC transporter substrate-binding protein [Roseofilum sp. SID2]MBP0038231.1 ABC transporter substrate-binding protein [Roseofilum sp. SID1]MBP0040848.1 ABC transporter substrate-binding protein [Roseofilum sp. SBFL]